MPCPECGVLYTGRQFIVYGVPSAGSTMSPGRIAAAIVLVTIGVFIFQFITMLWMAAGWIVALAVLAAWIAAIVFLISTGPRVKGGKSRFVFVEGGVNVVPMKIDSTRAADTISGFRKFVGDERVRIKRISPVWARLRLESAGGLVTFDAGIRCPTASELKLMTTLNALIRGESEAGESAVPRPTPPTE